MYDLFVFDLDGTLIDSVGDIADALNHVLQPYGVAPHDDARVAGFIGSGVRELVRRALPPELLPRLDELTQTYRAHYLQMPTRRTTLYPGVAATLAALPGKKAVATNKPGALSRRITAELGIDRHFFAVLGEDDVGRVKPDPTIVDRLREQANVPHARTLYVGDSLVDADTAGAARVDLALVGYGYADPKAIAARAARFHVARFDELLQLAHQRA
ncbi:MAG TPA: HAD-IA family hydrolase [Polyangia bacterium]|nr:HAD-IA family hydrolase [Polyangia bacterium]